jgi:hypothetical protein
LIYLITAAAEVLPTGSGGLSRYDELDTALAQNDFHRSSNGVAVSDYPSDGVDSERDEIHSRLQSLELDLSAALKTLRSRFDKVLSNMVCIRLFILSRLLKCYFHSLFFSCSYVFSSI